MPVCLKSVYIGAALGVNKTKGAYEVSDPALGTPVDGTYVRVLVVDPHVADLSTCAYVAQSGAEVANSLFSMTAADGGMLSGMIVAVWAGAFGIRQIINIVRGSTTE